MVGWFVPPIVIPAGLAIAFAVYALLCWCIYTKYIGVKAFESGRETPAVTALAPPFRFLPS